MKCAPIEAAFLCLDPAKHTSGAGLLLPDYGNGMLGEEERPFSGNYYLAEFGKVETQEERGRFVEALLDAAEEFQLPPVVVAEEWDPPRDKKTRLPSGQWVIIKDPKWTYRTILGIGEGWGLWNAEFLAASAALQEEGRPGLIVERFTPNEWRDEFFGPSRAKESEALKAAAMKAFEHIFGYAASDDIAEAGCLGLCGTVSPKVAAAVAQWRAQKKPARKKKRRAS
jgi:hypothetical protein